MDDNKRLAAVTGTDIFKELISRAEDRKRHPVDHDKHADTKLSDGKRRTKPKNIV